MLTFLRKIRKSLIGSSSAEALAKEGGSARKYLLYAIGEIALVVFGILIALQINNWNEWRKDRSKEKEILLEIVANLETNLGQIKSNIEASNYSISAKQLIKSYLEGKPANMDSIDRLLGFCQLATFNTTIVSTGYEMMKSEGSGIIGSTHLRKPIIGLYELEFPELNQREINRYETEQEEISKYLRLNAVSSSNRSKLKDYKSFLIDHYFLENLKPLLTQDQVVNFRRQEVLEVIERVLELIKDELGQDYTD